VRGKEKRARARWVATFEVEAGEAGEGLGSGVQRRVDEKNGGDREGAPGAAAGGGDSSSGWHGPLAGGHGRRRCHATGEGGGARVTQRERLTGGTGGSGARWPAAVCE
jgi:hypothetical protein